MEPKSMEEAVAMLQAALQALIANAPSPELGQQLTQHAEAIMGLVGGGGKPEPASPEVQGNPNAQPVR